LTGEPAAKAQLEAAIGDIYYNLGEYDHAERNFRHALAIYSTLAPPDDRGRLNAQRQVGRTVAQLGRLDEGERLTQQVLDEAGRRYGKLDALYVDATHDLGAVRNAQGRYREALALFEEGIENLRAASEELSKAEARVQRLVERADGTFDTVDARE
jgi:tetratricopeptide (TPR) repeat protein